MLKEIRSIGTEFPIFLSEYFVHTYHFTGFGILHMEKPILHLEVLF